MNAVDRDEKKTPPGVLPEGTRVYAVGDIHGRLDLLQELAGKIERDLASAPVDRVVELYVGDYIDRGPDSRGVVEWMMETPPLGNERICLMGNHEEMLLQALNISSGMTDWLFNGGDETIASYLVGRTERPDFPTFEALRQAFVAALPESHRKFFSSLPRMAEIGGYLFVHAGIRPGVPLDAQDPEDLIWIREPFLDSDADFGKVVVHGHSPVSAPEVRANRIGIDTGAAYGGRLTCLVLEGAGHRFLATSPGR